MYSEDNGNNSRLFLKPQYRGSGRYQQRDVFDHNNREAGELWEAAAQADHPMRNEKGTIAQLTATPYQIARNSLPSALYKSGGGMAGTYGVMSLEDDWSNAESDTQQTGLGMISRLEQASLMRMAHELPTKFVEQVQDQSLAVGNTPWRTSYARPDMKSAKFDDGRRNWSDLQSAGVALGNYRKNRSIYGVPTAQEIQQERYIEAQAQGPARYVTKETMGQLAGVVFKLWQRDPKAAASDILSSGLFAKGMKSSGMGPQFMAENGIDPTDLAKMIAAIIKALKEADKKKKSE